MIDPLLSARARPFGRGLALSPPPLARELYFSWVKGQPCSSSLATHGWWLAFYPRQTMASVIAGLKAAFAACDWVPRECLFDHMRTVILDDARADGGKLLENRHCPVRAGAS